MQGLTQRDKVLLLVKKSKLGANLTLTTLIFFSFRNGLFLHISEQWQALEQLIERPLLKIVTNVKAFKIETTVIAASVSYREQDTMSHQYKSVPQMPCCK